MEQKNQKREVIKYNAIKNVGCNLVLFPATILILTMLFYGAWICLKYSFFGLRSGFIEPYEDKSYLVVLAVLTAMIYMILRAGWRNAMLLHRNITRYHSMQQETLRIERLMQQHDSQLSDSAENMLYSEESDTHYQSKQ